MSQSSWPGGGPAADRRLHHTCASTHIQTFPLLSNPPPTLSSSLQQLRLHPPLTLTPSNPCFLHTPLIMPAVFSPVLRTPSLQGLAALTGKPPPQGLVIDSTALSSPADWKDLPRRLNGRAGASGENSLEPSGATKSDAASASYASA